MIFFDVSIAPEHHHILPTYDVVPRDGTRSNDVSRRLVARMCVQLTASATIRVAILGDWF